MTPWQGAKLKNSQNGDRPAFGRRRDPRLGSERRAMRGASIAPFSNAIIIIFCLGCSVLVGPIALIAYGFLAGALLPSTVRSLVPGLVAAHYANAAAIFLFKLVST